MDHSRLVEMKKSVRSLPPRRMQDIRCIFEAKCDNMSNKSPAIIKTDNQSESLVKARQTAFDRKVDEIAMNITPRHMSPPRYAERKDASPSRGVKPARPAGRPDISPSRVGKASNAASSLNAVLPVPSPRKTVTHNTDTDDSSGGRGIAGIQLNMFGKLAGAVALSDGESSSSRVTKLVGNMEQSSNQTFDGGTRQNMFGGMKDRNPNNSSEYRAPVNLTKPNLIHKNGNSDSERSDNKSNGGYRGELKSRFENPRVNVPNMRPSDRPISVSERSKMFENISGSQDGQSNISTPATKPAKPRPPVRQKSWTEESYKETNKTDIERNNPGGKRTPIRPRVRPRSVSLIERNSDDITDALNDDTKHSAPISNHKPPPPSKPPRTHAHDDYIKVKLEQEAEKTQVFLDDNQSCDTEDSDQIGEIEPDTSQAKFDKRRKPLRPPPPNKNKKQIRPFSIATDSMEFMPSEGSGSDDKGNGDSPYYEQVAFQFPVSRDAKDTIKHWDLPRASHPEPIRRSLSSDCINKAVDDEGNVVYMEPSLLCIKGEEGKPGYDIYVDTEGYAVPHRLVKKTSSSTDDDIESDRRIGDRVKSKFRKFKNLFETDKVQSPVSKTPVDRGSQKQRIDKIRQKVNQAFEVLQGSWKRRDSEAGDGDGGDNTSNESDSRVDEQELKKRVEYSRSVRIKASASVRFADKPKLYPQLFEHAMIVGLQSSSETGEYEPYVRYKFPEIRNYKLTMEGKLCPCSESKDSNVSVPQFCFPDAASFKPSSSTTKSQSYSFVLTNFDGGRVHGYCRRLVPSKSTKLPEVICIISPVEASSMYNTLLKEIEDKRLESMDAAQELIASAFGRPLPAPGMTETVKTLDNDGEMETIFLTREADNRIENVNCECLLTTLGTDKLLKVFASVLMERSVLFCAKQLSILTSTIRAITALLYPFSWQHTYVPVLPASMIDVVCSPTPYIMGIPSSLMSKALTLPLDENVLVVDVDKKSFLRSQGDEGSLIPKKLEKALKTALNMCRIDSDAKSSPSLMISEAFLRFFIEAVGHYGQYIHTQPFGKMVFQTDKFINGASSKALCQLLEWFTETQMFEVFKTNQLERKEWGRTLEYFQTRIQEHQNNPPNKQFKRRLAKKLS